MILCRPERDVRKSVTILIIYSVLSVCLSMLTYWLPALQGVFTLLFFALSAAVIMLFYRYTLTQYIYQLTLTELSVIRIVGRQSRVLFSFSLEDSKLLVAKQYFFKDGQSDKWIDVPQRLDACQNIFASCYFFICGEDGKEVLLKFEPNELFVRAMLDNISNAKRNKD